MRKISLIYGMCEYLRLRNEDPITYEVCSERGREGPRGIPKADAVKMVARYLSSIKSPN